MKAQMPLSNRVTHIIRQLDRSIRVRGPLYTIKLAGRVILREGLTGVRKRLDALGPALRTQRVSGGVIILTMPHTLHFAKRLQAILLECGITAQISDSDRASRTAGLVFAIAPQNFPAVPTNRLVAFQVEQHVATDRWTSSYIDRLAKCRSVWDFSIDNIFKLREHVPFRNIYHVPFWPMAAPPALSEPRQGILFYGDATPPRRQRILNDLSAAFPTFQVESNLFGPLMEARLNQTKFVVNIHAQEGALLETARISEALSHGCIVVSESASDTELKDNLIPGLVLVPEGDSSTLIEIIKKQNELTFNRESQGAFYDPGPDRFRLAVLRALLGMGLIEHAQFDALSADYPDAAPSRDFAKICLSLPESPERARDFIQDNNFGFRIWPGLKASPGWRGAGLSYRRIFRELRAKEIPEALIVEDDVILPVGFENHLKTIRAAMDFSNADMFSGLIVDLHKDVRILDVERRDGLVFVHLDRAVMMICNLYRARMIDYLADWDPEDDNPFTNTIDRYMERATHLRTITTLPFLASYRASAGSTLRESDNKTFDSLLLKSEALLAHKVYLFESNLHAIN